MSDPAKSAREIEDVLASIRRLVSESHVARDPDPQPEPSVPPAPRLVLTPALRVSDPDDPWAPVPAPVSEATAGAATADADEGEEEDASWGLEDRLSDWGEIEDSADEAVADAIAEQAGAPDLSPGPAWPEDAASGEDADLSAEFAATPRGAVDFEPETGDADWPDGSAGRALRDLVLARAQGGEAAVPASAETDSDMDTDMDMDRELAPGSGEDHADLSRGSQDSGIVTGTEADSSMTEDQTAPADEAAPRPGFAPVFSRRIDVRRASAETSGAMVDDVGAQDAEVGDAGVFADDVEDLGEAPQPFTFPEAEEGLLDEETLRDIIAEVVREELQGALGQRITRNVRKMVRREIRLALAAEDFE